MNQVNINDIDPNKTTIIYGKRRTGKSFLTLSIIEKYIKKQDNSATIIQKHWRRVLAQRRLSRMKINREIDYLPGIGIKYFEALEDWNKHI